MHACKCSYIRAGLLITTDFLFDSKYFVGDFPITHNSDFTPEH